MSQVFVAPSFGVIERVADVAKQYVAELCTLLVDEVYGELSSVCEPYFKATPPPPSSCFWNTILQGFVSATIICLLQRLSYALVWLSWYS